MLQFSEECGVFAKDSLVYIEKDREAFINLMDCYKLPKDLDEDKRVRSEKILENTILSMKVPLELAEKAISFYDNVEFAVKYGNESLVSDGVAAIFLHSAIEAAVINIKVNYSSIKDKDSVIYIPNRCKELINESLKRKNRIVKYFNN